MPFTVTMGRMGAPGRERRVYYIKMRNPGQGCGGIRTADRGYSAPGVRYIGGDGFRSRTVCLPWPDQTGADIMRMAGIKKRVYRFTYDKQRLNKTALQMKRSLDEVKKLLGKSEK